MTSNQPQTSNDRRKRILIDHDQVRIVTRLSLALVVSLVIVGVLGLISPIALGYLLGAPEWGWGETRFRAQSFLSFGVFPLLSGTLVFWVFGIRETLRVIGPTVRFRRVFEQLGALSVPSAVRIRHDDYLQGAAVAATTAMKGLRDELSDLEQLSQRAMVSAGASSQEVDSTLCETLQEIQRRLAQFTQADAEVAAAVVEPLENATVS